jgi:predicted Zn finger-like uncharacterized protein
MSLATRCTACGTIFRVVQDQLKVSEGWVRCGRCQQVFNALQCLFDLDREAPPPWPAEPAGWDRTTPVSRRAAAAAGLQEAQDTVSDGSFANTQAPAGELHEQPAFDDTQRFDGPAPDLGDTLPTHALLRTQSRDDDTAPPPSPPAPSFGRSPVAAPAPDLAHHAVAEPADDHGFADARFHADHGDGDTRHDDLVDADDTVYPAPSLPSTLSRPATLDEPPEGEALASLPQLVDEPSFVRAADREARWQRRPVRAALWAGAVALALLLAAQALVEWRDGIAARWPAATPLLQALCAPLGCRIEPPRQLDQLAVAGTALTRAGAAGQYRLVVTLNNHAPMAVMLPALELTLSDAQGQLVARKVLLPQDLGPQRSVPAHGEITLQASLATGGMPVVGYAVEIFYP